MEQSDRRSEAQAREQGAAARRGTRPIGANPYRGNTPLVRALHQAWDEGWQEQDRDLKARRRA